jgi:hypothetical protein
METRAVVSKDDVLKELNYLSEKLSTLVWTLNLGALGLTWSLLITSSVADKVRFTARNAIWIFVPSMIALLCEFGQYLSGLINTKNLCDEMEEKNLQISEYRKDDPWYKARLRFFWAKIGFTVAASSILVYTLLTKIV